MLFFGSHFKCVILLFGSIVAIDFEPLKLALVRVVFGFHLFRFSVGAGLLFE